MGINDWQKVKTDKKMVLGRYIVADPKICHGKLTFRGTRIFVAHVLDQVAAGDGLPVDQRLVEWLGELRGHRRRQSSWPAKLSSITGPRWKSRTGSLMNVLDEKRGAKGTGTTRSMADTNAQDRS